MAEYDTNGFVRLVPIVAVVSVISYGINNYAIPGDGLHFCSSLFSEIGPYFYALRR
jgi:hypothetical protein